MSLMIDSRYVLLLLRTHGLNTPILHPMSPFLAIKHTRHRLPPRWNRLQLYSTSCRA
ncbi:hypothetical protein BDZ89DRAFT_1075646, partial [Hymenopellis radicata]